MSWRPGRSRSIRYYQQCGVLSVSGIINSVACSQLKVKTWMFKTEKKGGFDINHCTTYTVLVDVSIKCFNFHSKASVFASLGYLIFSFHSAGKGVGVPVTSAL